jgi:hypothetical protein
MLDTGNLRSLGQDLGKVAAPHCRVFAGSPPPNLGEREHALDSAAHSTCRLCLCLPDRLDHLEYQSCINVSHGNVADDGIGIVFEGIAPLLAMLGVLPSSLVGFDELLGGLLEDYRSCVCGPFFGR